MKKRLRFVGFSLCLVALSLPVAADMLVVYAEGDNEIELRGSRQIIEIGDELPSEARVLVAPDGYLELDGPGGVVRIHNPGVYLIANLEQSSNRVRSVRSGVPNRITTLISESNRPNQTAVSGVRGRIANPGRSAGTSALAEGLQHLNDGRLDDAEGAFLAGYAQNSDPSLAPAFEYFIAWIEYQRNDFESALAWVQSATPSEDSPYLVDLNLLHARILLESFDPVGAVVLLHHFRERSPEHSDDPELLLLMGTGYANAGETDLARSTLSGIVAEPQRSQARALLADL